ncbi:MAG TPA: response regulator [Trichormus sp. M33_DOE_039]|nr:response regulator [Trichormus sp. M33_DOE_039]
MDERIKGLAEGAFAYLVKPITRAQFGATLDQLQPPISAESAVVNVLPKPTVTSALILLAEDNQANINTMSGYLESRGYRLAIANNGQKAIEQLYTQHPDLIVMDIQMPEMDGLEAIRRIRGDEQFVDVPIIALTALAMPGDRETCLAAGANEYLTKPIKLKQLIATIQKLLTR